MANTEKLQGPAYTRVRGAFANGQTLSADVAREHHVTVGIDDARQEVFLFESRKAAKAFYNAADQRRIGLVHKDMVEPDPAL